MSCVGLRVGLHDPCGSLPNSAYSMIFFLISESPASAQGHFLLPSHCRHCRRDRCTPHSSLLQGGRSCLKPAPGCPKPPSCPSGSVPRLQLLLPPGGAAAAGAPLSPPARAAEEAAGLARETAGGTGGGTEGPGHRGRDRGRDGGGGGGAGPGGATRGPAEPAAGPAGAAWPPACGWGT